MGERAGTDRLLAVAETVLVAAIWSSSFVGGKVALAHAGPLTVAGLRYFLAFALLIPWLGSRIKGLPPSAWRRFAVMGIAQYTVGNGALFGALRTLSATAGSLALCMVPIAVLFRKVLLRGERPRVVRVLGVGLSVGGCALFFSPRMASGDPVALGLLGIAILAFAVFPIVGQEMAQGRRVGTIPLTAIPLGIGGGLLVVLALVTEGVPRIPLAGWGVIVGLAVINTALAYLLYIHACSAAPHGHRGERDPQPDPGWHRRDRVGVVG